MQTVEALNEVSCMPGEHMIVCDNDVLIRRTAERALNVIREQQAEIDRLKGEKEKAVVKTKEQIVKYDKQALESNYVLGVGNGLRYALEIFTGNGGAQE